MPGRGKLGELPNRSAPVFQEERFFRSECAGPASTTLPHPTPGVIRPLRARANGETPLFVRSIAVEGYSVATSLGMSCKALLTTLLLNASKERRSNGIAPGCEPGVVGSDF